MEAEASYTVARAARRAGVSESTVRLWISQDRLTRIGASPTRVRAADVDALRAQSLSMYDDILDLSSEAPRGSAGAHSSMEELVLELRSRIATLELQLRQVTTSHSMNAEALQQVMKAEQILL